ncbi:hypothetical protein CBS101457_002225 [Exobasidium rhododendri]|nr:hypothetical protein CBS101457_002225 [Exobasidium rhododendri]
MSPPWYIDNDWRDKAVQQGIQAGTARLVQYRTSLRYKNHDNVLVPTLAGSADPFSQSIRCTADRAGILAVSQVPVVVLLSGRSSPIQLLTGCSFATAMLYHRWVARLVSFQVLLHGVAYTIYALHVGGREKYVKYWHKGYFQCGVVAAISVCFLIFLSLRRLRKAAYEFFVSIHIALAVLALASIYGHLRLLNRSGRYDLFLHYLHASTIAWMVDKCIRIARMVVCSVGLGAGITGRVSLLPSADVLKIVIIQPRGSRSKRLLALRPGHHVLLWVPCCQLLGGHPFSIAEIYPDPDSHGVSLVIYAKVCRGLTKRMAAKASRYHHDCDMKMFIEGFYGQFEKTSPYDDQILIAGGIGITHCLPYFTTAIEEGKDAHLIWVLKDLSIVEIVTHALRTALDNSHDAMRSEKGRARIILTIVSTGSAKRCSQEAEIYPPTRERARATIIELKEMREKQKDESPSLQMLYAFSKRIEVRITPLEKRPILSELLQRHPGPTKSSNTLLLCCGPAELCDASRGLARQCDFTYFEESFGC